MKLLWKIHGMYLPSKTFHSIFTRVSFTDEGWMTKMKYHQIPFPNKPKTLRKAQVCLWDQNLVFSCSDIIQNEF